MMIGKKARTFHLPTMGKKSFFCLGLWLTMLYGVAPSRVFALEGAEGGEHGIILLIFAWANFLLFLLSLYLFARKPLREFLGYRYLTLTRSLRQRAEEEARLHERLKALEEMERSLPAELKAEEERVHKEVEREVQLLQKEWEQEGETLRAQYRARLALKRREMEQALLSRVISSLRKGFEEGLTDRDLALFEERYLRLLELRKG
jgi:F0F1-type ATP synthase membrane subunit b/b'